MNGTQWTKEQVGLASLMWLKGDTLHDIAAATGKTREAVCGLSFRNRDLFPKRRLEPLSEAVCVIEGTSKVCVPEIAYKTTQVTRNEWTLGYNVPKSVSVSLPHVSFING